MKRRSNVDRVVQCGPEWLGGGHQRTEWWVDGDSERWVRLVTWPGGQVVSWFGGGVVELRCGVDPTGVVDGFLEQA